MRGAVFNIKILQNFKINFVLQTMSRLWSYSHNEIYLIIINFVKNSSVRKKNKRNIYVEMIKLFLRKLQKNFV